MQKKINLILVGVSIFLKFVYNLIKEISYKFVPSVFRHKKDIQGQIVVITGAGSGLGRQLAVEFSKYSTCVVLLDINRSSLLITEKLMDRRSTVFLYECDVSNRKMVYEVAKQIQNDAGKVDILINNAGIVVGKNLMETPDEMIEKTMAVNALAHFWTCKAFLPGMMERNAGHIVSIASVAGYGGCPRLTHYCTSKFAAVGFSESLFLELRKLKYDGIKVTTICPSVISTGLFEGSHVPFTKPLTPEEVAKEVVQAVQEEKFIVFLPGYGSIYPICKLVLPVGAAVELADNIGFFRVMDGFIGRTSNNNSTPQIQTIKAD